MADGRWSLEAGGWDGLPYNAVSMRLLCALLLFALQDKKQDALEQAVASITVTDLRKHAETLASDAMEGRNAGTAACDKAAEYIEQRFKALGLKTSVQEFEFPLEPRTFKDVKPPLAKTRNVLGLLEGASSEVVVIGAHYDHVGRVGQPDPGRSGNKADKDEIWNGADDNASGVAGLLELAEAFVALKPRRSVLFVAFSAEEYGLYGSKHFVKTSREGVIAMINLDMIGRNPDRPVEVAGVATAEPLRAMTEAACAGIKTAIHDYANITYPDSDHYPFYAAGIPSIYFFTGFHDDYHGVADHADKLSYDHIQNVTRAVLRLAHVLAEHPTGLAFAGKKAAGRTLGIVQGGRHPKGGILVGSVEAGSLAERLGLQKGDAIIEANGTALPEDAPGDALRIEIDKIRRGKEFSLKVRRGDEAVELKTVVK